MTGKHVTFPMCSVDQESVSIKAYLRKRFPLSASSACDSHDSASDSRFEILVGIILPRPHVIDVRHSDPRLAAHKREGLHDVPGELVEGETCKRNQIADEANQTKPCGNTDVTVAAS